MKRCLLIVFLLAAALAPAQTPTPPQHKKLLYADSLTSATSTKMGTITNTRGRFIPGRGWNVVDDQSQLMIQLPAPLSAEGTFIINVTNFDPVTQNVSEKQNILALSSSNDMFVPPQYETGSWWLFRTGYSYSLGEGMAGFRIDYAPKGVDTRSDGRAMEDATWSKNKVYEFKVIWTPDWIGFYIDNKLIMSPQISKTPWKDQTEFFRYLFVGRDSKGGYLAMPGPIWFNARIYVPGPALSMSKISGDGQSAWTNNLLADSLAVKVTDDAGTPQAGVPVTWSVTSGGAQIIEAQPVLTDARGLARVHVRMGAGAGPVQLQAAVDGAAGSPVAFAATATLPSISLRKTGGDGQSGQAGRPLPLNLGVQPLYPNGTAVANEPLTWQVISGGGTLNGQTQLTFNSDANGLATAAWTLGPAAGQQMVRVSHGDSTVTFQAMAQPSDVQKLELVSGGGQTMTPGQPLAAPIVVRLSDEYNNPVPNRQLLFQVTGGGGHLVGQPQRLTDTGGLASVTWTMGPWRGAAQKLQVTASGGATPVQGSPLEVMISGGPLPDSQLSTLTASSPVIANGREQSVITLTLRDATGAPLAGYTVRLEISGSGNQLTAADSLTDARGEYHALLSSRVVETKTITALIRGAEVVLAPPATVLFEPEPRLVPRTLALLSGGGQYGEPGQPLPLPVTAVVRDQYGNPFSGQPVLFTVTGGGGSLAGAAANTRISDALGRVAATWTLGRYRGAPNTLQISSSFEGATLEGSPLVLEVREPGLPDLTQCSLTATTPVVADGMATAEINVTLRDQTGRPMAGFTVDIQAEGSGNILTLSDSLSNSSGLVRAQLASTVPESKKITAAIRGLEALLGESAVVLFTAPPPKVDSLLYVSGDRQHGRVGAVLEQPLVVRVLDAKKQPRGGARVEFAVISGGGLVGRGSRSVVLSDTGGYCRVPWTLGPLAGIENNRVSAVILESSAAPLHFTATATAGPAARWYIVSGDQQSAGIGQTLPLPLCVKIEDAAQNPVSDFSLLFSVIQGEGGLPSGKQLAVTTDGAGEARASWTLGPVAGVQIVEVYSSTAPFEPLRFTARANPEAAAALIKVRGDSLRLRPEEAKQVELAARVVDRFGNPVPGIAVSFAALDGGRIISQAAGLSDARGEVSCLAGAGSKPGRYHFRAQAGPSITADFALLVEVPVINQPPVIIAFAPADTLIQSNSGKLLKFQFDAVADPDGDPFTFRWLVNGVAVGSQPQMSLVTNVTMPPEFTVVGLVTDDRNNSSMITWHIRVNPTGVSGDADLPLTASVQLQQNFPNPFNSATTIRFELPRQMHASLRIYDLAGQVVATLAQGELAAGAHAFQWQGLTSRGEAAPSGLYYSVLEAGAVRQTRKLLLMR